MLLSLLAFLPSVLSSLLPSVLSSLLPPLSPLPTHLIICRMCASLRLFTLPPALGHLTFVPFSLLKRLSHWSPHLSNSQVQLRVHSKDPSEAFQVEAMLRLQYLTLLVAVLSLPQLALVEESSTQIDEAIDQSPSEETAASQQPSQVVSPVADGQVPANESFTVDTLFLPQSFLKLGEPLNSIVRFITRLPIRLIAWILGENADILGLQMQQIGNALISVGAESLGLGFKDYGLSVMAFGRTVKQWFVNEDIPKSVLESLREDPANYQWWNGLGDSYLQTRMELEKMYSSQF